MANFRVYVVLLWVATVVNSESEFCLGLPIMPFSDIRRRNHAYVLQEGETPIQDGEGFSEGWYGEPNVNLYSGAAPGIGHCGTRNPLYLLDGAVISTNESSFTGCIDVGNLICEVRIYVTALFCPPRNYNVYYLYPIQFQESAYCIEQEYTPLDYRTPVDVTVPTPVEENDQIRYKFVCEFDLSSSDDLWYMVTWYVDNQRVKTFPPIFHSSDITQQTTLQEDMLGRTSFGFEIQCGYAVSFSVNSGQGPVQKSANKYMGITILTPSIEINDGQTSEIIITATVPFSCTTAAPDCSIQVNVVEPDASLPPSGNQCDPTTSFSNCGITIPSTDWNLDYKMTVSADAATQYGSKSAVNVINLKTASFPSNGLWENYDVGAVTIRASHDTTKIQGKSCSAVCDPHMRTFYGQNYEHQHFGLFTLYENKDWKQEIQIQTAQCSTYFEGPYCVCGMAIRVGKEVFVMDHCELEYWSIGFTQCSDADVQLTDITRQGSNYKIRLPSGLTIDTRIDSYNNFLNIYLYPSEADVTAEGLCGRLDYEPFTLRDGTITAYLSQDMPIFSDSWRVTGSIIDLFSSGITGLESVGTGGFFCKCTTPAGSTVPEFTCEGVSDECSVTVGNSQTVPQCKVGQISKRSAKNHMRQTNPLKHKRHNIKKRTPSLTWRNGWTQPTATDYCDTLFNNSTFIQTCKQIMAVDLDIPRANCILDIEYMGDASFALAALEAVTSQCLHEVTFDTSFHLAVPGQTSVLDEIKEVACPLDCYYRGNCIDGICLCNSGYAGNDCSRDTSVPPLLHHLADEGHCDLQQGKCTDISVYGGNFIDDGSTVCKINTMHLTESGTLEERGEREEGSYVESIGEVKCSLSTPTRRRRSSSTSPEVEFANVYVISVSNNGVAYSNSNLVVVFNSMCQFCIVTASGVTCKYTGDYCMSGGECYGNGEPHLIHECYSCSVTNGVRQWAKSSDGDCDKDDLLWIIGVVFGVVALLVIVVLVNCLIKKKHRISSFNEESDKSKDGDPPPYSTTDTNS